MERLRQLAGGYGINIVSLSNTCLQWFCPQPKKDTKMRTFAEAKARLEDFIDQHPEVIGNIERVREILTEISEIQATIGTNLQKQTKV